MNTNIISFPTASRLTAANDDHPRGPGGHVISAGALRRRSRVVRNLRGVALVDGAPGAALAA